MVGASSRIQWTRLQHSPASIVAYDRRRRNILPLWFHHPELLIAAYKIPAKRRSSKQPALLVPTYQPCGPNIRRWCSSRRNRRRSQLQQGACRFQHLVVAVSASGHQGCSTRRSPSLQHPPSLVPASRDTGRSIRRRRSQLPTMPTPATHRSRSKQPLVGSSILRFRSQRPLSPVAARCADGP